MNYILGFLDDSTHLTILYWTQASKFMESSEPVFYNIFFLFGYNFNSITFYNIYILICLGLSFIFTYRFFSLFSDSKYAKIFVTTLFCLSPYFYYKMQHHISLISVWALVFYITYHIKLILNKELNFKKFSILGFILGSLILYSNYLGYIAIIFSIFSFFYFLYITYKSSNLIKLFISYMLFATTSFTTLFVFNFNYIYYNYLNNLEAPVDIKDQFIVQRDISDFILFSSKPWLFFLPPLDNPFTGFITMTFIEKTSVLNSEFFQYTLTESPVLYLGFFNLILFFGGYYLIFKKRLNLKTDIKNYRFFLVLIIGFIILSLPPYFYLFDFKIYTPSYLLYYFFPMFRVLSRFILIILLFLLIFVLKSYDFLIDKYKNNFLGKYFIAYLFLLSLLDFWVKFKISYYEKVPDIYIYANDNLPPGFKFFVYPSNKTAEALFWTKNFKGELLNEHGKFFRLKDQRLYETEYTNEILKCESLTNFKNVDYIFVFDEIISKDKKEYFSKNFDLVYDSEKSDGVLGFDYTFFQILNVGANSSNNGKIYKFDKNAGCKN